MRNWHGVVGTRKQTAAIFIFACFLLPHKKSGTATWQLLEAQPKERKGEEEEEISLVLILPPPPPIMGGKSGAQIPSERQRNELLTKTRTQISCACVIICCVGGKRITVIIAVFFFKSPVLQTLSEIRGDYAFLPLVASLNLHVILL